MGYPELGNPVAVISSVLLHLESPIEVDGDSPFTALVPGMAFYLDRHEPKRVNLKGSGHSLRPSQKFPFDKKYSETNVPLLFFYFKIAKNPMELFYEYLPRSIKYDPNLKKMSSF